jgi:acetyl esterase/lipase
MASAELDRAVAAQRALLHDLAALGPPLQRRARYSRFFGQFPTPDDVRFEPVQADGVWVEWVTPPDAAPRRIVLYLHGGGYGVGSPVDYRDLVPRIARAARARALSVDYRLAPEHPHPAAVEDAVTAYRWLLANGGTPAQTVIAGDSAGGGLTVATLLALRDRGVPLPAAGVCISPWVDMEASGASVERNAEADPFMKKAVILDAARRYLQGQDPRTPLAAPLYADLGGLPPLLIQVGSIETLLDDAVRLAERARAVGVEVTLETWDGMPHIWHCFASFLPEAQQAIDRIGAFVQQRTSAVGVA